jgi:hypothetical protein
MVAATTETASSPILTDGQVVGVAIGVGIIAFLIVLLPVLLNWSYRKGLAARSPEKGKPCRVSVFEIPYITWFIVHYGVAALAILAIVLLGVDNVIDKATVSALLGSLFGYVLGSASHSGQAGGGQPAAPQGAGAGSSGGAPDAGQGDAVQPAAGPSQSGEGPSARDPALGLMGYLVRLLTPRRQRRRP